MIEQVVLTALPAGVDPARQVARLSCFVTLRATGEADILRASRHFADWPRALAAAGAELAVEIAGTGRVPARVVSGRPESRLWRALFPPDTPVQPHEPERWTQRPVATYAARAVHEHVVEVLARAAAGSPSAPPRSTELLAGLDDASRAWAGLLDIPVPSQLLGDGNLDTAQRQRNAGLFSEPMSARLDGAVAGRLADSAAAAADRYARETGRRVPVNGDYLPATAPVPGSSLQAELARFLVFHHRPEVPPTVLPDAAELARDLDFEKIQTALGGYGFLLRRLGLVIDLELPLDAIGPDEGRIRIVPPSELPAPGSPWTAYRLPGPDGAPAFRAAPRPDPVGERVADGLLDLGFGERYSLAQVDVDSAAFKTLNAALATAARVLLPRPVGSPDTDAAPALRSTGLAVLHDGRAEALHGRLAAGHNLLLELAAGDPPTLYAEDVTRGYRIDISRRRDGDTWHSLHARRGHYVAVGPAAGTLEEDVEDEGFSQLALGQPALPPGTTAGPTAPVYLHESMARWEGWSLSAPRPGLGLSRSPQPPTPGDPESQPVPDRNEALPDGVPLEVTFHAQPGSLPRLRVGEEYRLRARAVDLAGNGPTIAEADALLAALDAAGARQPVLPARDPFAFRRFDPLAGPAVVPRRADTEGESVEHAVLRSDHDLSAADYAAATGYLPDTDRHLAPAKASLQDAELLGCFDAAIGSGDAAAVEAAYTVALRESGRFGEVGGDAVHPEDQLVLPYLPDPWSVGTALVGLPGLTPGTVTRLQPDGTLVGEPDRLTGLPAQPGVLLLDWGTPAEWWQAEPFRLRVVEGSGPPSWDAASRLLSVELPKAARVDVQVSSLPDERHLDEHGAWRALLGVADPGDVANLRQLAGTGRLWVLSPARTIRLVHALQHPLHVPDVLVLAATRLPSSTSAVLGGEIRIHAASTDRVDLTAGWPEWVDSGPGSDAPSRQDRTAVALTQPVHLARDLATEPPAGGRAQAARFTEADDLLVLGAGPRSGDTPEFLSAHELHDTRHRRIAYRAVATSRFREYFRPDLVSPPQALTRESEPVQVDVPSSAPPPPPGLLYAVPMFGWERSAAGRARTTRRRGGGLRLFLSRSWYASGDGELLGVVLWPGAASCPVPAALDQLVTRWGFDPVWPAAPPPAAPAAQHFPRGVAVAEGLPLREDRSQVVTVVGHEVEFDAGRDLWTCDLELDLAEAYTPFVRLALVRYQPCSIAGAHLSAVTTAQIVQVSPERTVSLTAASDDPLQLSLVVTGPGHGAAWQTGGVPFPFGSEVEVWVEERDDAIADPDLGWRRLGIGAVLDHGPGARGADVRYSGRVRLPADHFPGRHRVVVVERERLATDPGHAWAFTTFAQRPTTTRTVFAETFVV